MPNPKFEKGGQGSGISYERSAISHEQGVRGKGQRARGKEQYKKEEFILSLVLTH